MGEIAEGLINGDFDSVTGEYLGEGHGYPRSIYWNNKRTTNSVQGVKKYLSQKKIYNKFQYDFCIEFIKDHNELEFKHSINWNKLADMIQSKWPDFVRYVNEKQSE